MPPSRPPHRPPPKPFPPPPRLHSAAAAALVGDPKTGHQLTYTCQGCHGITGYKNAYPSFKVPLTGGQSAEYLAQGAPRIPRRHPQAPDHAGPGPEFSDQDIADIAAFLSTLK